MTHNTNHKIIQEERVKFLAPRTLKSRLQRLADERNISLSALMRLITSEYVKRNSSP